MEAHISTEMINYTEVLMFNLKISRLSPTIFPKKNRGIVITRRTCLETITSAAAFLPVKQTVFVKSVEIFARD